MPRVSGKVLADRLRERWSRVKVMFISGYTGERISDHGVLDGAGPLLRKPFTPTELVRTVREVLDGE